MKNYNITIFDSLLRSAWYSPEKYPLSAALYASARQKHDTTRQEYRAGKRVHTQPQLNFQ